LRRSFTVIVFDAASYFTMQPSAFSTALFLACACAGAVPDASRDGRFANTTSPP
jgi:hypothetical protein